MPSRTLATLLFVLALLASVATATPSQRSHSDRELIAACLILEAANQGEAGMQAVAAVIANRAKGDPASFVDTVTRPYAFTALNTATTRPRPAGASLDFTPLIQRAAKDRNWPLALALADQLYAQTLSDNTFGADHYSRTDELPSWSHGMRATAVIGDHLFFRSR